VSSLLRHRTDASTGEAVTPREATPAILRKVAPATLRKVVPVIPSAVAPVILRKVAAGIPSEVAPVILRKVAPVIPSDVAPVVPSAVAHVILSEAKNLSVCAPSTRIRRSVCFSAHFERCNVSRCIRP